MLLCRLNFLVLRYEQKWYVMQSLPMLCVLVYAVPWGGLQAASWAGVDTSRQLVELSKRLGATFSGLYLLYFGR